MEHTELRLTKPAGITIVGGIDGLVRDWKRMRDALERISNLIFNDLDSSYNIAGEVLESLECREHTAL